MLWSWGRASECRRRFHPSMNTLFALVNISLPWTVSCTSWHVNCSLETTDVETDFIAAIQIKRQQTEREKHMAVPFTDEDHHEFFIPPSPHQNGRLLACGPLHGYQKLTIDRYNIHNWGVSTVLYQNKSVVNNMLAENNLEVFKWAPKKQKD